MSKGLKFKLETSAGNVDLEVSKRVTINDEDFVVIGLSMDSKGNLDIRFLSWDAYQKQTRNYRV